MPAGSTPQYWNQGWATLDFSTMVQSAAHDALRPLFARYAMPGRVMLEGGCGLGHYVAYYTQQGVKTIGLDFAHATLAKLHRMRPELPLIAGDVAHLPFASASFDVYYSGGVVEHFEHGPEEALKEARRVIRDEGVLLISVPYCSPLRRALSPIKREWRRLREPDARQVEGHEFFQYAFTRREFSRRLRRAGLKVVETFPYSVLWGIKETPGIEWLMRLVHRTRRVAGGQSLAAHRNQARPAGVPAPSGGASRGVLPRVILSDDYAIPVLGAMWRLVGLGSANLMMYVCKPDPN